MTQPTQAQIEAGEYELKCTNGHDRCYMGTSDDCPYCERVALTAAAQVGEPLTDYTQWDKIVAERDQLRAEKAAAQVGDDDQYTKQLLKQIEGLEDKCDKYYEALTKPTQAQIDAAQVAWQETARRTCSSNEAWIAALAAAAQIGEIAPGISVLALASQQAINATIERCVQVVERYAINIGEIAFTISAELRKLTRHD